jgi:hypothetical protein
MTTFRVVLLLAVVAVVFAASCGLEQWADVSGQPDPQEVRLREEAQKAEAEWCDAVNHGRPPEECARLKGRMLDANRRWTEHAQRRR